MYNLKRNNYNPKPKSSNIQTPPEVSQFIFELLKDKIGSQGVILDPCVGKGNLLKPWEDNYRLFSYDTYGVDIDEEETESNLIADFLTLTKQEFELNYFAELEVKKPILILCNPPFNGYGKQLGSEVWLDKIIELFGKEVPVVLFAPVGFRVTRTLQSKKWMGFANNIYPTINSTIALPENFLDGVKYEILIFNIKGLKDHYFYHER